MQTENTSASAAGVTAWNFLFYLPASITHAADPDERHEFLQAGLEAYLASSNKSSMKFWVTVIIDERFGLSYPESDNWKYLDDFADYVANLMTDPQYLKINGKPVIGMYGAGGGASGPTITLAQWQQFLAPAGGQSAVYGIQMSGSAGHATTYGLQAVFVYGINNLPSSQGHQPFSVSAAVDRARWVPGNFQTIAQINAVNDSRALHSSVDSVTFVDQPTQPQLVQHFATGLGVSSSKAAITFWNESAEEGAAVHPTTQEGTRYLDAIEWTRTGNFPSTYTYAVNAYNADAAIVASSGTWTYVGPLPTGVVGAHDRDQVISANTGDYKELIHERLEACDVYAETGPDCGICEIYKDGVLDQTIDCYAASQTTSAKIATVTFSSHDDHRVKVLVKGTKNASSSSVQLKLDYFKPTYIP